MIVNEGKYYLYRHIRLDKNEPFYIGIGTRQEKTNPYLRMTDTHSKNNIWQKIVLKTKYECEVILESDDNTFIQDKEREFIELYGRICKNNGGILANIESGGRNGYDIPTIQKKIYCCNNKKWYESIKEASFELNVGRSTITRVVSGEASEAKGLIFKTNEDCIKCLESTWFPIIDEKYNYYINENKVIKRISIIKNINGEIISKRENNIKPIVRKNGSVQMTFSFCNKRFNINLKKEYKKIFNKDWNGL